MTLFLFGAAAGVSTDAAAFARARVPSGATIRAVGDDIFDFVVAQIGEKVVILVIFTHMGQAELVVARRVGALRCLVDTGFLTTFPCAAW